MGLLAYWTYTIAVALLIYFIALAMFLLIMSPLKRAIGEGFAAIAHVLALSCVIYWIVMLSPWPYSLN